MVRTIPPERPLDPVLLQLMAAVAGEASGAGVDYMLVGATARDILLTHVFGLPTGRATYDVDFAVAVASWDEFALLKQGIATRPGFTADARAAQRLYYSDGVTTQRYPLDLVPFGAIASNAHQIIWPPDMAVVMNVIGFDEVLAAAEQVAFMPGLTGRVASLAGLAVLKLVAWGDRRAGKDAQDLLRLMEGYAAAGNHARLYDVEYATLEAADHDPTLAGACLLGKDVARLVGLTTRDALIQLIGNGSAPLVLAMVGAIRHMDNARAYAETRLGKFVEGLTLPSPDNPSI